ncbi:MAG: APC family permease [Burkholderiales bacterium]|nr:APC family permease [Burkholderiales bacterium]
MAHSKGVSTFQIMLLSTGGMLGAGWLFSPYYGFHTAGLGVILSWIIVAIMTFIIGLSFAEVSTRLPIVGGISRYMGITHDKKVSFVFLTLGWLSYVVYLPLEIQSCVQYLGFWFSSLVDSIGGVTTLSYKGLVLSLFLMFGLTWFNTLVLGKVARANSFISLWKIVIPLVIAWILIIGFGDWNHVKALSVSHKLSYEPVLLAITQSGMAFAFTGFQNGLILANSVNNPKKALPYSIFSPLIIGFLLYCSLSLAFIFCIGNDKFIVGTTAPLLGLVGLFGIHIILVVLFIDAIIAPLGTANVYTASTSRILLGLARDFLPKSMFVKLNKNLSPAYCLWVNLVIGACFLLPFPTWTQLVNFLSSIVVFAYIAGPISLIILRKHYANEVPTFKVWNYKLIANLGFIFCSLLVYWSGLDNLSYLIITLFVILVIYGFIVSKGSFLSALKSNLFVIAYVGSIILVAYLRKLNLVLFPYDNLCIVLISLVMCKVFVNKCLMTNEISINLARYNLENTSGIKYETNKY